MANVHRKRSTNKKPTAARAKAHDRKLLAKAEAETGSKLGPRVVHQGEAEYVVNGLAQVLENLLDLAEIAEEHPYNEIVLESLLKVRQMRSTLQTELGNYARAAAGGAP